LARSFNLACLLEVGQEAKCTICKFHESQVFYEQGSLIQECPSSIGVLQPYFNSSEGISRTSLHCSVLDKIHHRIFSYDLLNARKERNYYQQATYEDNFSMCPQPRILFWFTSSGFLKRPISLKYWLLRPFSTRKPHAKAVP
jgi:hypothetical protein